MDADPRSSDAGRGRRAAHPVGAVHRHDQLRRHAAAEGAGRLGCRRQHSASPSECCSAASSPAPSAGGRSSSSTCRSAWPCLPVPRTGCLAGRVPRDALRRLDVRGALTLVSGLLLLVYGIEQTRTDGWTAIAHLGRRWPPQRRCSSVRVARTPHREPARAAGDLADPLADFRLGGHGRRHRCGRRSHLPRVAVPAAGHRLVGGCRRRGVPSARGGNHRWRPSPARKLIAHLSPRTIIAAGCS